MIIRARLTVAVATIFCVALVFAPSAGATSSCRAALTSSERAELASLTKTSANFNLYKARTNVTRIAQILVPKGDYRGTFAIFYRDILGDAIPAIERGEFADNAWTTKISTDVVKRYFDNLNAHVTGLRPTVPWQNFYNRSADCGQTPGRVVMAALTAHLVVDFPESVLVSGATPRNKGDFFKVGDLLVATTPKITADIRDAYGYDLDPFFKLWFASDLAYPVLGGVG